MVHEVPNLPVQQLAELRVPQQQQLQVLPAPWSATQACGPPAAGSSEARLPLQDVALRGSDDVLAAAAAVNVFQASEVAAAVAAVAVVGGLPDTAGPPRPDAHDARRTHDRHSAGQDAGADNKVSVPFL